MAAERKVQIGEREFSVRELTVQEIRALTFRGEIASPTAEDEKAVEQIGWLLFDDIKFIDLLDMSSVTLADLGAMRPSEIRTLAAAVKEVNADFFDFRRRFRSIVDAAQPQPSAPASASEGSAAS